ncbi:MAG TPA: valine--tRNA ligase [Acidimicrobiales bacterium]|nr:valine--tRNA ligase [Acidimicrobiales bacterium]
MTVPEKPSLEGLEAKWRALWEEHGTFRFDRTKTRDDVFAIDTPPPTVSGALHIGHCESYTHKDLIARYQRMRGKEVFYPMGWDDNGLNVERRVQLMRGVLCDPSLPYDPDFTPSDPPPKRPIPVSRPNFMEICADVVEMLEEKYHELWSTIGLSVDWTQSYTTIGPKATRVSQYGFLRLLERGLAYRAEGPTLWDVDMKTAVAQAELEDRVIPGAYHRLVFRRPDGSPLYIDTTRPELLAACVAVVAHPDDDRYKPLMGTQVTTPLFGVSVPVVAHELADPEKGTGIAMICTFGDTTDVIWWRELDLPVRAIVEKDGRIATLPPPGLDSPEGLEAYGELAGKNMKQAQTRIVELLRERGGMEGEPKPIEHPVKFWENGSRALEIVTNRQWFITYPDAETLLEYGNNIHWHPEFMGVRYENWVNGLVGDWNITRQRFFGVPFPIWYPIDADGNVRHDQLLTARYEQLPIDPSTDVPDGYTQDQRDKPGGFTGDPDVMDTWATSSLTPLIASGWPDDLDLHGRVFPMDMRPQSHDIIRTWLFYTVIRSHYEFGTLPWSNALISGFVRDPDRKKLSKSAGNSPDDPMAILAEYGSDAVRYWAAGARPGMDLAFDRNQFKVGRRLATKILNASRFALSFGEAEGDVTDPLDLAMLRELGRVIDEATTAFDDYDYARALERTETFFWSFCDDYLELVKARAYTGDASAITALRLGLSALLRLFAPVMSFVTEEVWSWWQDGSIHRSTWPVAAELGASEGDPSVLHVAAEVLGQVRKAKTAEKKSLRADVESALVRGTPEQLAALDRARGDVIEAGRIADLRTEPGDELLVDVTLAS